MQDIPASSLDLQVVMPVYNEQEAIGEVVGDWCVKLDDCGIRYVLIVVDDGSRDGTPDALKKLQEKWGPKLEVVRQKNAGHGQAILNGYRLAAQRPVPWIFQIDSDGQCDPQYFPQLWAVRDGYDFVSGFRTRRDDGFSRLVISQVLRVVVFFLSGVNCKDANVPYRLMRTQVFAPLFAKIPSTCFFTNVCLSILAIRAGLKYKYLPMRFLARQAGESTVPLRKLGQNALTLCRNVRELLKTEKLQT